MKEIPLIVYLCFLFAFSCDVQDEITPVIEYDFESDLETVIEKDGELVFQTTHTTSFLAAAQAVSSEYSRSGGHALRLDSTTIYGLNYRIEAVAPGSFIELSVWSHSNNPAATLSVTEYCGESVFRYQSTIDQRDEVEGEWLEHKLSFVVKPNEDWIDINVFAGGTVAYFDDFSFRLSQSVPNNELKEELFLSFIDSSQLKLNESITQASYHTTIPASCKKYVEGTLILGEDTAQIDVKLKGDWTDHLYSGKESLRIKMKGDCAFLGLKNFSIQHPKSRNFLDEWVVHKIADREDILTTTFDFINVNMNNIAYGVYALEEHFDKQLLESRKRREGPILKFDESSFWSVIKHFDGGDSLSRFPYFQQSTITVFKEGRTLKSDQLKKQFLDGAKLLNLFKEGSLEIDDIFDIDQLAKFYVLCEISGGSHALRWHNRRFYFNPVTQKLEHIAFDILPFMKGDSFRCLMEEKLIMLASDFELSFDHAILYNAEFKKRYFYYLKQQSKESYLDSLFAEIDEEMQVNLNALEGEFKGYQFDRERFYKNAAFLRTKIPYLDSLWEEKITEKTRVSEWYKSPDFRSRTDNLFLKNLSINAYRDKKKDHYELLIENYHLNPIDIYGYHYSGDEVGAVILDHKIRLEGYSQFADSILIPTDYKPTNIFFTVSNNPNLIFSKTVTKWAKPNGISTRMNLKNRFNRESTLFSIDQDHLIFSGKTTIDQLLYFPENFQVEILPGSEIEFKKGGGLIVTNSFYAKGTEAQPIRFFASDSTCNGLTILNGEEAVMSYVRFENMCNLDYENWELTGAVTIYETETYLSHCTLSSSQSEDALNIIRSHFTIDHLVITESFSDGFDADFCSGLLENSNFSNTGNDCIDFSGSEITLRTISIKNSGDKGISGGEASHLTLDQINIDGAITGIASKDGSVILGKNITISNTEYGCAAFRKKAEYEVASIDLITLTFHEIVQEILVEKGSTIKINGEQFHGEQKLDIEALYAAFD